MARENDRKAKERIKKEYDRRMGAREPQIQVGMKVLLKVERKRKADPRWDPQPYTIIAIKGTMVTAKRGDIKVTRNSSGFKPYYAFVEEENGTFQTYQSPVETTVPWERANKSQDADQVAPTPRQQAEAQEANPQASSEDQAGKRRRGRPTKVNSLRKEQERAQMVGDGMTAERMTPRRSERLSLKSGGRCGVQTTR